VEFCVKFYLLSLLLFVFSNVVFPAPNDPGSIGSDLYDRFGADKTDYSKESHLPQYCKDFFHFKKEAGQGRDVSIPNASGFISQCINTGNGGSELIQHSLSDFLLAYMNIEKSSNKINTSEFQKRLQTSAINKMLETKYELLKKYPHLYDDFDFDGEECLADEGKHLGLSSKKYKNKFDSEKSKGSKNEMTFTGPKMKINEYGKGKRQRDIKSHLEPAILGSALLKGLERHAWKKESKYTDKYEPEAEKLRDELKKKMTDRKYFKWSTSGQGRSKFKRLVHDMNNPAVKEFEKKWKAQKVATKKKYDDMETKLINAIDPLIKKYPKLFTSSSAHIGYRGENKLKLEPSPLMDEMVDDIKSTRLTKERGSTPGYRIFADVQNRLINDIILDDDVEKFASRLSTNKMFGKYAFKALVDNEEDWTDEFEDQAIEELKGLEQSIESMCEAFTNGDHEDGDIGTVHHNPGLMENLLSTAKTPNEVLQYKANQCFLLKENPPPKGGIGIKMIGGLLLTGVGTVISLTGLGTPLGLALAGSGGALLSADAYQNWDSTRSAYYQAKGLYAVDVEDSKTVGKKYSSYKDAKEEGALELAFLPFAALGVVADGKRIVGSFSKGKKAGTADEVTEAASGTPTYQSRQSIVADDFSLADASKVTSVDEAITADRLKEIYKMADGDPALVKLQLQKLGQALGSDGKKLDVFLENFMTIEPASLREKFLTELYKAKTPADFAPFKRVIDDTLEQSKGCIRPTK
jgi:hypothetical protein